MYTYTWIGIETTNDQAVILGVSVFEFSVLFVVNDDTCNDDALSSSSSSSSTSSWMVCLIRSVIFG